MTTHWTDEELLERMEAGAGVGNGASHASDCEPCQRRLAEIREAWRLAAEVDVPEPSPLYWESFRRQVGRRLAELPSAASRGRLAPFLALAAVLLVASAVVLFEKRSQPSAPAG